MFEAAIRRVKKRVGDAQIPGCGSRIYVPHEGGQVEQAPTWVNVGAVPAQESLNGKGVAQAVQAWRVDTWRNIELQLQHETVESIADRSRSDRGLMMIIELPRPEDVDSFFGMTLKGSGLT